MAVNYECGNTSDDAGYQLLFTSFSFSLLLLQIRLLFDSCSDLKLYALGLCSRPSLVSSKAANPIGARTQNSRNKICTPGFYIQLEDESGSSTVSF